MQRAALGPHLPLPKALVTPGAKRSSSLESSAFGASLAGAGSLRAAATKPLVASTFPGPRHTQNTTAPRPRAFPQVPIALDLLPVQHRHLVGLFVQPLGQLLHRLLLPRQGVEAQAEGRLLHLRRPELLTISRPCHPSSSQGTCGLPALPPRLLAYFLYLEHLEPIWHLFCIIHIMLEKQVTNGFYVIYIGLHGRRGAR